MCTNLRTFDGKRPIFIDTISATFFFPYHGIRFLEIPERAGARHVDEGGSMPAVTEAPAPDRRARSALPALVGGPDDGAGPGRIDDLDIEIEVDEDFLQRVRDA